MAALDVGGSGIVLSIQRIELLVESMFRGDAGVDGTADGPDRRSLHDRAPASNRSSLSLRPKKRGPFHLVPVIAKATLERSGHSRHCSAEVERNQSNHVAHFARSG